MQRPPVPGAVLPVLAVLEQARGLGLLGPGPVMPQVVHALGFAEAAGGPPAGPAVDLGSGAGIPGLPLALLWAESRWALVDSSARRTAFLTRAMASLDLGDRVEVVRARAEEAGREEARRGRAALVVARSFGPPAVTAECGCPFLGVGGRLIVSEPPEGGGERWPAAPLALLRATAGPPVRAAGATYRILEQMAPCPGRFPRRPGIPVKRPLF